MPQTAQIVISMDSLGNLICEGPGLNGQRTKIEGFTFEELPPAIQDELTYQRLRIESAPKPTLAPSIKDRMDPEVERHQRNEREARERRDRWNLWLASLSKEQREVEEAKLAARLARAEEYRTQRAKDTWYITAQRHGVPLANRVITDPARRPRIAKRFDPKTKKMTNTLKLGISLKI